MLIKYINSKISVLYLTPIYIVLFIFFFLYSLIALFGYGTDFDIYYLLETGKNLFLNQTYSISRKPGFLIPEFFIGGSSLLGGYFLSNFLSICLGLGSLYTFYCILLYYTSSSRSLLTTAITGLNPYFIIAASSSMDYVYSLFFGLMGLLLIHKNNLWYSSLFFAFCLSSRLSYVALIVPIYFFFIYKNYTINKRLNDCLPMLLAGILTIFLTLILFSPSYISFNYSFDFLSIPPNPWSIIDSFGRFIFKNIYLNGFLSSLFIFVMMILNPKFFYSLTTNKCMYGTMFILYQLLFFKYPFEISYLLPLQFIITPVVVYLCSSRVLLYILFFLVISYSFLFKIDFLNFHFSDGDNYTSKISKGIFIRPGVVTTNVIHRYHKLWDFNIAKKPPMLIKQLL